MGKIEYDPNGNGSNFEPIKPNKYVPGLFPTTIDVEERGQKRLFLNQCRRKQNLSNIKATDQCLQELPPNAVFTRIETENDENVAHSVAIKIIPKTSQSSPNADTYVVVTYLDNPEKKPKRMRGVTFLLDSNLASFIETPQSITTTKEKATNSPLQVSLPTSETVEFSLSVFTPNNEAIENLKAKYPQPAIL